MTPDLTTSPNGPEPITGPPCDKCHQPHDPGRCQAHSKRQGGAQCHLAPMTGQRVCGSHGGRARQARQAGAVRVAEEQARKTLGKLAVVPVDNPLQELQHLAGEARAWKEMLAGHVANLERMRYSTDGGEAIRGEILLFERAMDRCATILGLAAKLNIDERLARITEMQKTVVINAINAALKAAGVDGAAASEGLRVAARHLRVVNSQ